VADGKRRAALIWVSAWVEDSWVSSSRARWLLRSEFQP
jgi:hypothetical protein